MWPLGRFGWTLWKRATSLTFSLVKILLHPFIPHLFLIEQLEMQRRAHVRHPRVWFRRCGFDTGLRGYLPLDFSAREPAPPGSPPASCRGDYFVAAERSANCGAHSDRERWREECRVGWISLAGGLDCVQCSCRGFLCDCRRVPWLTKRPPGRLTRAAPAENAVRRHWHRFNDPRGGDDISRSLRGFRVALPAEVFRCDCGTVVLPPQIRETRLEIRMVCGAGR